MEDEYIEIGLKFVRATVASDAHTVTDWIRVLQSDYPAHKHGILVGLDVTSATLHLCVGYKCLIVQMDQIDSIPGSLRKLLHNMRYVLCGVDMESTVKQLNKDYAVVVRSYRDIGERALEEFNGMSRSPGVKELARLVAGLKIPKPSKAAARGDWGKETLTYGQIKNACIEAHACWKVAKKLANMDESSAM